MDIKNRIYALVVFLFFFKQKTAYEMRISDWSSDVCSSDLEEYSRSQPFGIAVTARHYSRLVIIKRHQNGMGLRSFWPSMIAAALRSEARRVGKECGSTCRSRW